MHIHVHKIIIDGYLGFTFVSIYTQITTHADVIPCVLSFVRGENLFAVIDDLLFAEFTLFASASVLPYPLSLMNVSYISLPHVCLQQMMDKHNVYICEYM